MLALNNIRKKWGRTFAERVRSYPYHVSRWIWKCDGNIYLYQLLTYLFNLKISTEMSFEKLTWKSDSFPWFVVHLNYCQVRTPLSFSLILNLLDFFEGKNYTTIRSIRTKEPSNSSCVINPMAFYLIFVLDLFEWNLNFTKYFLFLSLLIPPYLLLFLALHYFKHSFHFYLIFISPYFQVRSDL